MTKIITTFRGAECGNKVVPKGFPTEAVGITCKVDGKWVITEIMTKIITKITFPIRYQVVEYSEITSKSAEARNEDGSLVIIINILVLK